MPSLRIVICPNCSLTVRGALVVFASACALCLGIAAVFTFFGLWPVLPAAGMEMIVLDQTREEIGLPVAKVVVPGLRHFWSRYAPGRLYDVPVQLGWLSRPTAEDDLNPIPMFL